MKQEGLKIAAVILAIVLGLIFCLVGLVLFQRPSLPMVVDGKTVAVVRRSVFRPFWYEGVNDVYVGENRIFSLPDNWIDGSPIFIYPFADGKRFLCDQDDDTAMLDFIVELDSSSTNGTGSPPWPADAYVREHLLSQATNVVFNPKGIVRLPTYAELREVSDHLAGTTSVQTKPAYFFLGGLGAKDHLLLDLATNRQSLWPLAK
jgi:hypothetical protein